jgi:hypothetical protein
MKKPRSTSKDSTSSNHRTIDIKGEIPEKQLASLGAMALAFNEMEAALDRLFFVATELSEPLKLEIATRIGGLDGKKAIVLKAAEQFLSEADLRQLQELFGDGAFGAVKDYPQESVFLFTKPSGKSAYFLCPAAQR